MGQVEIGQIDCNVDDIEFDAKIATQVLNRSRHHTHYKPTTIPRIDISILPALPDPESFMIEPNRIYITPLPNSRPDWSAYFMCSQLARQFSSHLTIAALGIPSPAWAIGPAWNREYLLRQNWIGELVAKSMLNSDTMPFRDHNVRPPKAKVWETTDAFSALKKELGLPENATADFDDVLVAFSELADPFLVTLKRIVLVLDSSEQGNSLRYSLGHQLLKSATLAMLWQSGYWNKFDYWQKAKKEAMKAALRRMNTVEELINLR